MQKIEGSSKQTLWAFEDPISTDLMEEPIIHTSCGNSMDRANLLSWFDVCALKGQPKLCPRCNEAVVGMEEFVVNRDLQSAIEEFSELIAAEMSWEPPARPNTPAESHLDLSLATFGKAAQKFISNKDPLLFTTHIEKETTKEISIDSTGQFAVILKSKKWRVYRIGDGACPAKKEHEDQNIALKQVPL